MVRLRHGKTRVDMSVYLVRPFPLVVSHRTQARKTPLISALSPCSQSPKLVSKALVAGSSKWRYRFLDSNCNSARRHAKQSWVIMCSPNARLKKEASKRLNCSKPFIVELPQMTHVPYVTIEIEQTRQKRGISDESIWPPIWPTVLFGNMRSETFSVHGEGQLKYGNRVT